MGCDIHMYREKRVDCKWVTADEWDDGDVSWEKRFTNRNYNLFSILAGVREREAPPYKFKPRGLPLNISEQVAHVADEYGRDGHSHSYLYLHELQDLRDFLNCRTHKISGMKNRDELEKLRESISSGEPDWDLLYPYCQGTNDPKQAEFEIDVPASVIVGNCLDSIIESLEEIDGCDLARAVFWFDN